LTRFRAVLLTTAAMLSFLGPVEAPAQRARPAAPATQGGVIQRIAIEGNQRIDESTIRSYMLVSPGDPFSEDRLDRSLKSLFATGLFEDVSLRRDGATLTVHVVENPIVNRIAFEGNSKLSDDVLRPELQLRPRAVFTPQLAQADRQRLLDLYARRGRYAARVEPKIIKLDQNRVDVVFEITEGDATLISRVNFVGNHAFSDSRLKEVISSREEAWWRFLSSSDTLDPDRLNFDRELLRRFYLKNGYADVEITSSTAELAPDRSAFFVTYTINEGERYQIGKIEIDSQLRNLDGADLLPEVMFSEGDWYDGELVDRSATRIQDAVQSRGYAFVEVRPRVNRNREEHKIDLRFDVGEGPRVFVERIDITGNVRTQDKVIRREFSLAEGDAFSAAQVRRTRQRLEDLGYFNTTDISVTQGSAADRAILTTRVEEKATGELTIGGGYGTDAGLLASVGLRERNLLGSGVDAQINTTLAQRRSQIDVSVTDPYFLDRNLVAGVDLFHIRRDNQDTSSYSERRTGFALRVGYAFNDHLRQSWNYTLSSRNVYDIDDDASLAIREQEGTTLLSQLGQTLTLDYRDSRIDPTDGWVIRLGTDFAGLGGDVKYLRTRLDGAYYFPLERFLGDPAYVLALSAGGGYLWNWGGEKDERIVDRFFLGGDNLRGFEIGGAGPRDVATGDSLGGRLLWTQSTELRFPLPFSSDLGLTGRAFVDVGSLSQLSVPDGVDLRDEASPRVGAGVGISWKSPFGVVNIDLAHAVVKKSYDETQIFRFGFGTRF